MAIHYEPLRHHHPNPPYLSYQRCFPCYQPNYPRHRLSHQPPSPHRWVNMTKPNLDFESQLWKQYRYIAGIDEVGRGALAGPVVTAAVVLPTHFSSQLLPNINDSKLLTSNKRLQLAQLISQHAIYTSINTTSVSIINRLGINKAIFISMRKSLKQLPHCDHVLVDGYRIPHLPRLSNHQTPIIKGDSISISIAAASILAKVYRDHLMDQLHLQIPHYFWNQNKGYGTTKHAQALQQYGPTQYHRHLFIRKIFKPQNP